MKKIAAGLIILSLIVSVFAVFGAQAQSSDESRGEEMMSQMMGVNHEAMDSLMDRMMGASGTRSMHEMMGKMSAKGISAEDMKPLAEFMSGCRTAASGNYNMMGSFGNMMGYGFGVGGAVLLFGWLVMIIFWIIVAIGAVALLRWIIRRLRGESGAGKAMETLKERYAKGEISKEEFEAKKKDIK